MPTSSLTAKVDATVVRLDINGDDAVIDMGENPAYHPPTQVIELIVSYKTTQSFRPNDTRRVSEVTDITYQVTGKDYQRVSVHPDFLDQPDEWPAWVRELVDEHRPTD